MASLASAKPAHLAASSGHRIVFGPERDLRLSDTGLRYRDARPVCFKSDPVVERFTDVEESYDVKIAGYPQEEQLSDGRYAVPTFRVTGDDGSAMSLPKVDRLYARVGLVFTTKTKSSGNFSTWPTMVLLPLSARRDNLYSPAPEYETVSVSALRDDAAGAKGEITSIWPPKEPAVLFVQLLAVRGAATEAHFKDFNHEDVIFTFVVSHPRAHRVAADPNAEPKPKKPRAKKTPSADSSSVASAEELAAGITEELAKLEEAKKDEK